MIDEAKVGMDEKVEKFLDSTDWVFAKTYAKTAPHEYVVREKNRHLEDEFVYFVKFIRKHGYKEKFGVIHIHIMKLASINTGRWEIR